MSYKISYRIEEICKKLKINYHSPYLEKSNFRSDAIHLDDLYQQLKQIVAEIIEIADKHGTDGFSEKLWKDIFLIESADHDISHLADIMKKEQELNTKGE